MPDLVARAVRVVFVPLDVDQDVASESMLEDPRRFESDVRFVEVTLEFGERVLWNLALREFVEVPRVAEVRRASRGPAG